MCGLEVAQLVRSLQSLAPMTLDTAVFATLEFHSSMFVVAVPSLVPWPSSLGSSFWSLAVCKNEARRPGESYHVICDMADVTDSRHEGIFISSYREAGQTRQVPAERQVLPLEHNQLWSILQAIKTGAGEGLETRLAVEVQVWNTLLLHLAALLLGPEATHIVIYPLCVRCRVLLVLAYGIWVSCMCNMYKFL